MCGYVTCVPGATAIRHSPLYTTSDLLQRTYSIQITCWIVSSQPGGEYIWPEKKPCMLVISMS
jgi:hypothetical protein